MRKSLFVLIGSTCMTLTVSLSLYFLWQQKQEARLRDLGCFITTIVQTGSQKEALPTAYLAELLQISIDAPTNIYAFDLQKGVQKLLASPCIAKASIRKIFPHILYVDYEVRTPVALLGDYQNTLIDQDGFLFPMTPFFSPKELPEIYLGLPPFGALEDSLGRKGGKWQTPLQNAHLDLAFEVLRFLQSPWQSGFRVKKIDVSNALAPSLGCREIVLFTEEELMINQEHKAVCCIFPKILRLAPADYVQQLNNFFSLRNTMVRDYRKQMASMVLPPSGRFAPRIVDLRISQLAFVENDGALPHTSPKE
jgi:hypothetical protein